MRRHWVEHKFKFTLKLYCWANFTKLLATLDFNIDFSMLKLPDVKLP